MLPGLVLCLYPQVASLAQGDKVLEAAIRFNHVEVVYRERVASAWVVAAVTVFAPPFRLVLNIFGDALPVGGVAIHEQQTTPG